MIRAKRHRTARAASAAQAAPAGGARIARGRGCVYVLSCLAFMSTATAGAEASLPVPSGQKIHLNDVLLDENPGELWVRFRFVAPRIGSLAGQIGYDVAAIDMDHLCASLAIPYVTLHDLKPSRVVISLADRVVSFGDSNPEATQFFEAYRLENARCIWEEF